MRARSNTTLLAIAAALAGCGGGWLLDFERSSIHRSIRVIYAPDVEWPP